MGPYDPPSEGLRQAAARLTSEAGPTIPGQPQPQLTPNWKGEYEGWLGTRRQVASEGRLTRKTHGLVQACVEASSTGGGCCLSREPSMRAFFSCRPPPPPPPRRAWARARAWVGTRAAPAFTASNNVTSFSFCKSLGGWRVTVPCWTRAHRSCPRACRSEAVSCGRGGVKRDEGKGT